MTEVDCKRRWLLNAGGLAIALNALPAVAGKASQAGHQEDQTPGGETAASGQAVPDWQYVSPLTTRLADHVSGTLDRSLPANVIECTKLHVLDTVAAMVSGSRLKPGQMAARYVDSLGGKPEATVVGTNLLTSVVNATFANAMAAHADESDDSNPVGPFHAGCGCVPAALATAEVWKRSGSDVLRAVTLGYDVGTRLIQALGGTRHNPSCMTNSFAVTATAAALLRLTPAQVRYAFSYAGQQASGIGYWDRDIQHIEKAFDFGGMGARNGIMAATMAAMGFTAVEDPFSGKPNVFTVLGEKPQPQMLTAGLGVRYDILDTTIKQWGGGMPLQSLLDNMMALVKNPKIRAGNIKRIIAEVPSNDAHIEDNNPNPDLCAQHLIALTIVDRGAGFWSVHDAARMQDPRILAVRKLVALVASPELKAAKPSHQTRITIETNDGRRFTERTRKILGTEQDPMDRQQVEAKASDLMEPVLGRERTRELIVLVRRFERLESMAGLRRLLQA